MVMSPAEWPYPKNIGTDISTGYQYFCDVTHPMSHKDGKVWLHRHVAAVKIGRWLTREEHVHHEDDNKSNNDPANLLVLTNAEHQRIHKGEIVSKPCKHCLTVFTPVQNKIIFCSNKCAKEAAKKFDINKEDLEKLVWLKPTTTIAQEFGVTDTAVSKRCKSFGIEKPPRGYWMKKNAGLA